MGGASSRAEPPSTEERHLSQDDKKIEDLTHVLNVKAKSHNPLLLQKDINWDQHEQDKENVRLLKGLFKTLDPRVVRIPGDAYGRIQLSFKYEVKRQLLLVKVIQCRDLNSKDMRTKASDPYVKLQMYPDIHSHGIKMTQIVVETRNPTYNEIFAFKATEAELKGSRLVAQVWDYDVTARDDFLGEAIVDTQSLKFEEEPIITSWFDLKMDTDISITGELSVTVAYQMPCLLLVTVHGARHLSPRSGSHSADPFVKVAIPGVGAVHFSQIQKDTLDPVWEETFEFDMAVEELSLRYLVFHVVDQTNILSENHSMGQAILDLNMLENEPAVHTNLPLADLKNTERMQNKLMQQVVTQEFREACLSHTMSRRPDFLFQQHKGCKMVRVSCRKAGRTSSIAGQVRIMDGVPVF